MKERLLKKIDGCFLMIDIIKKEDTDIVEKIGKIEAQMGFLFGYFQQLKTLKD